jgi:hypothetical protein
MVGSLSGQAEPPLWGWLLRCVPPLALASGAGQGEPEHGVPPRQPVDLGRGQVGGVGPSAARARSR